MIDRKIGDKPINFEVTIGKIYGISVFKLRSELLTIQNAAEFFQTFK